MSENKWVRNIPIIKEPRPPDPVMNRKNMGAERRAAVHATLFNEGQTVDDYIISTTGNASVIKPIYNGVPGGLIIEDYVLWEDCKQVLLEMGVEIREVQFEGDKDAPRDFPIHREHPLG